MNDSIYYTSETSGHKIKKINKTSIIIYGQFLIISFLFTILYFHTDVYAQISTIGADQNVKIIKDPEKEVPSLVMSFGEKEVEMDPFMYSHINFINNK